MTATPAPARLRAPGRLVATLLSRAASVRVAHLPVIAGALSVLVGSIVLVGWWLGIEDLKSLVPGLLTMKANTALAFVMIGVGLGARSRPAGSRWQGLAVLSLTAVMVLSAAVGSQYLTGQDLGIDQWLFHELPGQIGTVQPNRMSPMSVISFLSIGLGVLLVGQRRARAVVPLLFVAALLLASLNILDFIFRATEPSVLSGYTQMALMTSVTVAAISVGAMGLLPHGGPLEVYVGPSSSAKLARRLVVASLVVPIALAWLRLQGEDLGMYGSRHGVSLMVLGTFAFMTTVIWQSARSVRQTEGAREEALEERDRFFDVSIDLLATAGADGYFKRLNPAWTTTLGYDLSELLSKPFAEFVHPDDRAATISEAAQISNEGKTAINFQNRYRHRNGTYRWLEWTATPSADRSHMYATARDITARKLEEERLMAPALAAQERLAAARRMIGGIIRTRAFRPVYQPIVDLRSGAVVGYEALTRFADGCPPDQVFASAAACGLGIDLETVTLEAAVTHARLLPAAAWLSLNVSPTLLCTEDTLPSLLGKPTRSIVLEVTEHEEVGAYGPLHDGLARLGPRVRLAVDDAGAGVANFTHLVELRPDFVKVDASLIRGVDSDLSRAALVVGLVHFAAAAGCLVVAEGIETEAEKSAVADLGVTLGQGYLLGRPAAAETWHPTTQIGQPRAAVKARRRLWTASGNA